MGDDPTSLRAIEQISRIHDAIFCDKTASGRGETMSSALGRLLQTSAPAAQSGGERARELASRAIEGAAELHRRLSDLSDTQDLLAAAMNAVFAMHGAACGDDEGHRLAGVGIVPTSDMGGFRIKRLIKNSPSEWVSGSLLPGDRLLAIDGQNLAEKTLTEVSAMLTGPPNTKVTVEAQREGRQNKYVVTLRRAGKEGDTRPVQEMCSDAVDAIKEMRRQAAEIDQKDAEMRKLAAALREAKAAATQHEANTKSLQEDMNNLKHQLASREREIKDHVRDFEYAKKELREWQARAQERERAAHALTAEKERLNAHLDKVTHELNDGLREIELQRSALAAKAQVEKKLQNTILEAHEVRGELAKSRSQIAERDLEIQGLKTELGKVKTLEVEVAELKERMKVAHRRLTESEQEIMRLRPFENSAGLLEKKLQDKISDLTRVVANLEDCQRNFDNSVKREGDLMLQLKELRATCAAAEAELVNRSAAAEARIQELQRAFRTCEDELQNVKALLHRCNLDLNSANDAIKEGLNREKLADQNRSAIQRSVAEQFNRISDLEAKLKKSQMTIHEKLPAIQKEVQQLYAFAMEKQEVLTKALRMVEESAADLKNEIDRLKVIQNLLEESQRREAQQLQELDGRKMEIRLLKNSLQSNEAEILALQTELEAKCKAFAFTTTQLDMSTIKCSGLEKETSELKENVRSRNLEIEQLKSAIAVLQGKAKEAESNNADLINKVNLYMQDKQVDKQKLAALGAEIGQLQEDLRAITQNLRKAEHDRAVAVAHGEDCIKQIHELKSTVGRLEMRIRALEAEKGGIVLEKGGLAEQLATLDNDFRELQQQLADMRCLLRESTERETYLKTLLDDLQRLTEQEKHEFAVQEAADSASAGRKLLDSCKGYVTERKGVGMVLRTVCEGPMGNLTVRNLQSKDFYVKQLIAGSSSANSTGIEVGDFLVAVDNTRVQGMTMEQVQDLILGPEGTTVAMTLLRKSPTGGVRYSKTLVRGENSKSTRSFAEEATEAVEALNNVHEQSCSLKNRVAELAKLLADAKANVLQLDTLATSQNKSMQELYAELSDVRAKLSTTERDFSQVQTMLTKVKDEYSTCESGRNSLQRTIAELQGKIQNYESRLETLSNEKSGNAEKLVRMAADVREMQQKLDRAQSRDSAARSDFEAREKAMKAAYDALQILYENALKEAAENSAAGRGLLNAASGHLAVRKGIGMVVRSVAEGPGNLSARTAKSQDWLVKQLIPGSTASRCGQIEVNDVVVAVDGHRIAGMNIEQVQGLILGSEGTTVTLNGLKLSPTGGERYSVTLTRGDPGSGAKRSFAEEAKEAIDALNNVHHEAHQAKTMRKSLEDQILELETRISKLNKEIGSRDRAMSQLQAEITESNSKLQSFEREKGMTAVMLNEMKEKHCSCEEGKKTLNSQIADLNLTIKDMESQIAETLGVKKAFDDSFNREQLLKAQLATLQSKYEVINQKASDVESAGYQLLDTMSGHAVERKGVGMVLRIENSKSHGEYEVKQLIAGGSASKSSIKVSDTVLEVDGHPISDLSIEHVTDLILGPQGTTVTITGMTSGARYSETLVRGETRHTRPFADEAKEAIDALQRTNQEAKDAKTACKSLEDQLTAAKSKMKELENKLETLTSSASRDKEQSKSMAEQVSSLTKQLEAFELQLKQAENSNVHLQAKLVGVNDALSRSDNDVKIERAASQKASSELKAVLDELSRMKLKLQSFSQSSEAEISKLKERLEASEGDVLRLTKKSNSLAKENGLSAGKLAEAQEAFYATTEALRGQYMQHCGVGMIVRVEDRNRCTITSLTPGGPAAVSGVLECGDAILKINGNDVQGMPLSLVQEQIIGAAGTIVILAGLHTNAEPFTVELVRGTNDMRQSLSVIELTQSNITTAKGMHKEIARLSRVYAEAQKTIQTLREEAEYAARREQALRLAMRDVEHDRVSTTGSLQSRMAEIELIRNDLQEREMRLAAAHEQCKKEKSRREEFEAANARLSKQIQDLHGDLEQQLRESKRLDTLLGTRCAELKDVTAERDATLGVLHGAQHEKQDLHAQVADLKRQVETNRQKLVLAASARQDLDGMRKIKYEELQMLKESSLSALQNLTDAEKDLAAIKQSAEDQRALYANNVGIYQASLAKEREMTTAIEKQLEMAKVEVTACRRLLELMRGYVGERKGVGMLVRTHPQKRGHYSVKEMVEGGSAALSNRISIGDTLLAVDDNEVTGLSIDDVQNLIVGPEGSAVTIKCHSEKGALNSHESDDMEHNGFFSPRGIQNLLTFRPRPNSTKGTAYTVTLLRGDWAQADNLLHETEVACDRVRSIHAENTEAKKLIGNLLLEAKQRQVALVEARRALNIMCQDVNIPLKETQKYFNVDDYFDDSSTDVQMNASTFVRLDSAVQFELDSMRKKSSDLLSDILKKAYSGLQCYKEQTEFSGELKRKLMTAESRNEHQSGTISDMKEKLAKTEVLLKSSQQEVDELRATVSKMDKDIAVLKADKNEKTAMLVDLKDQLAKVLEHKCAIQAEKDGLVARSRTLENQLGEAELLAAQRGTAISEMQDKMAEFEALSHKHITKLSQDNESLSKDLVDTQQVFKQTKERCEQQTDIISDVKDKLGSAEVNLKIVGEENDDLKQEVFKIKENESKLRARLSAMIEEHAAQSCTMQSKLELALEVQERLRREIEFVKKEKNAKDLYVTDVEGKLTSRETSLSDSQKEIAEYQKMSLELQERYERTELRRQAVETELSEAKMQNISLKSRIEALEQSRAAEEAHIKDKWMTALEELELSKRNFAKLEEEKQTLDTELKNAVSYLQRVYAAITARQNVTAKTRSLLTKSMLERADECEQVITISFTHIDELNDCVKELEGSIQREKDKTSRLSQELESARKEIVEQSEAAKKHLASVKVCEVELKALNKVNEEQASKVKSFQASTAILEVQMLETEKCVKQLSNDLSLSLTERKVQEERHTKECGDLRNKIADLQEAFKKLESELEARHMLRKREVEEHESRFSTTLSELDQFRASQSFLEHKQRQADEDSRVSKAEAEQYRREKAMLKSKLEVATQEVQSLKVLLNDLTAKEAAIAVKLSDSVSEGVQLKRMLHQLRDQLSTEELLTRKVTHELSKVREEEAVATRKLSEITHENIQNKATVQDLRAKLKTEEDMTRRLSSDLLELRKLKNDADQLWKEAEKNRQQSQQKVEMLLKDIEQLKGEIAKQKTAYKTLLSEHDSLRRDYGKVKQDLEMLKAAGNEIPVGVGLLITERHPHRILTVVENGSAAACGEIMEGDIIVSIDGTDVQSQDIKLVRGMLLGRSGSRVHLALKRFCASNDSKEAEFFEVTIIRGVKNRRSWSASNKESDTRHSGAQFL